MNFGAFAVSRVGEAVGTVERVILDLATNEVLSYVVHSTVGIERDVIVPDSAVSETDDALVLNINQAEVERLADYVPARAIGLGGASPSSPAPPQTVEISTRTRVECVDGHLGVVEGVVVDEFTMEVTRLIVQVGDQGRSATVPMEWVSSLHSTKITLQCTRADI
ncbi:MAG: PRC-barrel domain-containing protein [Chloroflexi bacterium]|nr:PRC-barrel domain-containing protein [Chloroflexota bacterium]